MSEIKELLSSFCEKHLNDELTGYAFNLCDALGRKKKINLLRGRKEIWAGSMHSIVPVSRFYYFNVSATVYVI